MIMRSRGTGEQQDYGMRIYDPRVGRFLSVDPLQAKFAYYSPYQFAGNSPIQATDLDGEEIYHYTLSYNKTGKPLLSYIGAEEREPGFSQSVKEIFTGNENDWRENNGNLYPEYSIVVSTPNGIISFKYFRQFFDWQKAGSSTTGEFGYGDKYFLDQALVDKSTFGDYAQELIGSNENDQNIESTVMPVNESTTSIHDGNTEATESQIDINKKNGSLYESKVKQEVEKTQDNVQEQVTIKTKTSRTRVDFIGIDKETGEIKITEAKASQTAPLTKKQKTAHPELEKHGGKIVGKGKPGYPKNTRIPPTKVDVKRQN
jgi:RHS repeat-associated protein